jgi:hypothetical protein
VAPHHPGRPLAGVVLAAALALGGCNQHLLPNTHDLAGRLILDQATPVERGGGECRGTGGYEDLRSGLPVTATDPSGAVLGSGTLMAAPAPTTPSGDVPEAERRRCVWTFRLRALPERASYDIGIGERGAVTYTREELDTVGWNVEVALGG